MQRKKKQTKQPPYVGIAAHKVQLAKHKKIQFFKSRDTDFYQCGAGGRGQVPPVLRQGIPPLRHPDTTLHRHNPTRGATNTRDSQTRTDRSTIAHPPLFHHKTLKTRTANVCCRCVRKRERQQRLVGVVTATSQQDHGVAPTLLYVFSRA